MIDSGRTLSQADKAVDAIRATQRPVAAFLITHAHPDHVGGLGVLHEAFPTAPMYAAAATAEEIRTGSNGFYALTRQIDGAEPARVRRRPPPGDHRVRPRRDRRGDGTRLRLACPAWTACANAFPAPRLGTRDMAPLAHRA